MIEEASLYADLHVETSPAAATAVWTDHIATVRDVSLTRGGQEPFIGVNNVETGSGTISLVDNTATIEPGYWVKVRYQSTIIWAGFVQDVNTTFTFIDGVTYQVKTLVVLDWVAWISQWSFDEYQNTAGWWLRSAYINLQIDPSGLNKPLVEYPTGTSMSWAFPKIVGQMNVGEVLDLLANSVTGGFWKANLAVPTGSTSGIDSLVSLYNVPSGFGSCGTLVDGTQTSSTLSDVNYVDIEMAKQTSAVVNNVIVSNTFDNAGTPIVTQYQRSDATSVATYGSRLATIDTSVVTSQVVNMSSWPSFEGRDYSGSSANFFTSVEQPALDQGGAWAAYSGTNALRAYNTAGTGTNTSQGNDERISVIPGTTYYMIAYGATTGTTSIRGRARIDWYNEANTLISTTFGAFTSFTSVKTWYKLTTSGAAPATASSARAIVYFDRGGTLTFPVTTKLWVDGVYFGITNVTDWFDGNTTDTSTLLYDWYGEPNLSQSFRMTNHLHTLAGDFLTDNKNPKYSPLSVRINSQAKLSVTSTYDLYKTVNIWRAGHRWTAYITGINHEISINPDGTTRWMIELIVRPSTYTI
jgi:hypothetical protein